MDINRVGSRPSGKGPADWFTGTVQITVKPQRAGVVINDVPMLLDTGADVSLLPRSRVAALALPDAKQYELEAFDGTKSTASSLGVLWVLGIHFAVFFIVLKSSQAQKN